MKSSFPPAALLMAVLVLIVPAVSSALSPSQVTLNFMCPCGSCDEALSTCECPSSDGFRSQIAGMVGSGYPEEEIIKDFVARFGPSVLVANAGMSPEADSSPISKKTFGFLLIMLGVSLAAFTLGRFMNRSPAPASTTRRPSSRTRSRKGSGTNRSSRGKDRFEDGVDDDLLDDYMHE